MTPSRSRFVTACQQLLALAVVLAVLTPAASLVTLDVVGSAPDRTHGARPPWRARPRGRRRTPPRRSAPSKVPTAPVKPGRPRGAADLRRRARSGRAAPATSAARVVARPGGASRLTTTPQPVTGFGEVGVTWASGVTIAAGRDPASRPGPGPTAPGRPGAPSPTTPSTAPTPARPRPGTPGPAPTRCSSARSAASRCGPSAERPLPADMKLAVISPGQADAHRDRARRARHQHHGRRQRCRLRLPRGRPAAGRPATPPSWPPRSSRRDR